MKRILSFVVIVALIAAPLWTDAGGLRLMGEISSFMALAVLWNLLAGYADLVSVGRQAFVGIGAYTLFSCCIFLGLPPIAAIPLAMLASGAVALIFAPLLFRLDGA